MKLLTALFLAAGPLLAGSAEARPFDPTRMEPPSLVNYPLSVAAPAAPGDTVWFGGTGWAADSARWEAVQGGVWGFDTGIASHFDHTVPGEFPKDPSLHALMEGWVGHLYTPGVTEGFFRRVGEADFGGSPPCVGDAGGLGGDYSLWAGVLPAEAESLHYADGGPGYGNNWHVSMRKEFFYPGSGTVTLEFDYVNDTEAGYDYTYVTVDTSGAGDDVLLTSYDGVVSGHQTLSLTPGSTLPGTAGMISIRFEVVTDVIYSDEDGIYFTTCGAFAVDNIELSGAIAEGPMTFETDAEGWEPQPGPSTPQDWSDVVALSDLPPILGSPCALQDSVLVFLNLDSPGPYATNQSGVAVSPWIDLRRAGVLGRRGKVLELDVYFEGQSNAIIGAQFGAQWAPSIDPVTYAPGESPVTLISQADAYTGTQCVRFVIELGHGIPLEAEQIRVAVGLRAGCFSEGCPGVLPTPWFDNIRLGVHGDPVSLPPSPLPAPDLVSSWSTLMPGDTSTRPGALASDHLGRVYVVDIENDRIQKYGADGTLLTSWGGGGSGPGDFNFTLCCPGAVDVSPGGFVFVADSQNRRVQKFTLDGDFLLEWGTPGGGDGQFFNPTGIAVDDSGFVYVASDNRLQKFTGDGTFVDSFPVVGAWDVDVAGGTVYTLSRVFGRPAVSVFNTQGQRLDSWGCTDHPQEGEAREPVRAVSTLPTDWSPRQMGNSS